MAALKKGKVPSRRNTKLITRKHDPYKIVQKVKNDAYKIELQVT